MYTKIFSFIAFILFSFPLLAAANLVSRTDGNCDTSDIQCCSSVQESSITSLAVLSSLLGIALPNIGGLIGLVCTPVSVLGAGGNSCSSQPVCCTNNGFNGAIALGCTPINLNL